MSKKRVSTDKHSAGDWLTKSLKRHGFIGVALSLAVSQTKPASHFLSIIQSKKKIFLSHLSDRLKGEGDLSADLLLHEEITRSRVKAESIAFNVPLTFPKCLRCRLKCPELPNFRPRR